MNLGVQAFWYKSDSMKQLTKQSFEAARTWLKNNGRPLEQAQFALSFEGGSADAVIDALSAFQNADGGYGHCLEPDHANNESTVLNTSVALAIHRRLRTPSDHPQVVEAMGYLMTNYDHSRQIWPMRPPVEPGMPGPPWFIAETMEALRDSFGGFRINPTAEIVGYLHDHAAVASPDWLPQATDRVMQALLDQSEQLSHHDLICGAQLLQSHALPAESRLGLKQRLDVALPAAIEPDTSKWHSYVFRPTLIIDEPSHPLMDCVDQDVMDADLAFEIDRVSDDGAWHPFWNWGPDTPAWRQAEHAWSSVVTERTLRVLEAFGRISPG